MLVYQRVMTTRIQFSSGIPERYLSSCPAGSPAFPQGREDAALEGKGSVLLQD